jgi:hypothetical protein
VNLATKKIKEPVVDAELLTQLRGLYARYTGQQIADCVAVIRKELDAAKEQERLLSEIAKLTLQLSK